VDRSLGDHHCQPGLCRALTSSSIHPGAWQGISLLKNPLGTRLGPRQATKHTGLGAFPSPILGRYQLNADFFNRLGMLSEARLAGVYLLGCGSGRRTS
jgi:hypothetical protein